jgi:hypothetical protein
LKERAVTVIKTKHAPKTFDLEEPDSMIDSVIQVQKEEPLLAVRHRSPICSLPGEDEITRGSADFRAAYMDVKPKTISVLVNDVNELIVRNRRLTLWIAGTPLVHPPRHLWWQCG